MQPSTFEARLAAARAGAPEPLGEMLNGCRRYLALLARRGHSDALQSKAGVSDIVQEAFLHARKGFHQFRGNSEAEWRAWLAQVLVNARASLARQFRETDRRRLAREVAVSSARLAEFAGNGMSEPSATPSSHVRRDEWAEQLQSALGRLPDNYRLAIELRQQWRIGFNEIGNRLGCSSDAARKVWARALVRLRQELGEKQLPLSARRLQRE